MRLGEAYVNIRADLKPYYRDLQVGLRETTAAFEKQLNKELGRRFGKNISDGAREELSKGAKQIGDDVRRSLGDSSITITKKIREDTRRNVGGGFREGIADSLQSAQKFTKFIASSLAGALDDGISALPAEIKAGITAGLILASPAIIAQLGSAVSAAIALGVAAGGIALASQLTPVQQAFDEVLASVRESFAEAAGPLIDPLVDSLEFFANFAEDTIAPRLNDLFSAIAPGIRSLFLGIFAGVDRFVAELTAAGLDLNNLLVSIGDSAAIFGAAIGKAFRILASTGRDGQIALRDLTVLLATTVLGVAYLVSLVTTLYGRTREIIAIIQGDYAGAAQSQLQRELERSQAGIFNIAEEYGGLTSATDEQNRAFKEQQQAAQDAKRAIDDLIGSANDLISNQIDQEESWARLKEGIEKHGNTLKLNTEVGRENATNVQRYLNDTRDTLLGLVEAGEITADEAEIQFQREVTALQELFGTTKTGKKDFETLFGEMIRVSQLGFDPSPWVVAFNAIGKAAKQAIDRIKELAKAAQNTGLSTNIKVKGGTQLMADGGRVTRPTDVTLGEGFQPELVLPETQPNRAAQILANSSLGGMLGMGETTVIAYFDGEPFQARIVRTARAVNSSTARTVQAVPRSV